MNVLCIGDVVGEPGIKFFSARVPAIKKANSVDFTIVNGENSAPTGTGIIKSGLTSLLQYADCVTTGNHSFRQRGWEKLYDEEPFLLRPANFMKGVPGHSSCILRKGSMSLRVINLIGMSFMGFSTRNPFYVMQHLLEDGEDVKSTVIDFHAEATSEKEAFARYYDGRISALFGTHTHVATAYAGVLPKGTGFIADVGMTGPYDSVLGVETELAIRKMKYMVPTKFMVADGPCRLDAVLFDIDESTGLCREARRISECSD
ncbi:MAG: TIGR00282 family metallophosphoesterase [Oscillospiraceae bacterium]|jgi:metallophosphoesterase (TIGR00282 family)